MLNVVDIEISKLNPADYNPRYLSPEALKELQKSINTLGIIKPVIVRAEDYKLLAGNKYVIVRSVEEAIKVMRRYLE